MMGLLAISPMVRALRRHPSIVALLVVQVAFSFAVISNMALMASHRVLAREQDSGLRESGLGVISVQSPRLASGSDHWPGIAEMMGALANVPGVTGVAAVQSLPLNGNIRSLSLSTATPTDSSRSSGVQANVFIGSPGMVEVLGLELSRGRLFARDEYVLRANWTAAVAEAGSVIISEQLAHRLFGSQDALGRVIYAGDHPTRIIGIVRHLLSPAPGLGTSNELTAIVPVLPNMDTVDFAIRTRPMDVDGALRRAVVALSAARPDVVVDHGSSFAALRWKYFQHDRAMFRLMICVLVAMLVVTVVGVSGLASFWVLKRSKSIGIRRALGAQKSDILIHFLVENLCVVLIGLGFGLVLAYGLNLLLIRHYGESPMAVNYLLLAAVLMLMAGQVAALGPARRAARTPPSAAMREG